MHVITSIYPYSTQKVYNVVTGIKVSDSDLEKVGNLSDHYGYSTVEQTSQRYRKNFNPIVCF